MGELYVAPNTIALATLIRYLDEASGLRELALTLSYDERSPSSAYFIIHEEINHTSEGFFVKHIYGNPVYFNVLTDQEVATSDIPGIIHLDSVDTSQFVDIDLDFLENDEEFYNSLVDAIQEEDMDAIRISLNSLVDGGVLLMGRPVVSAEELVTLLQMEQDYQEAEQHQE